MFALTLFNDSPKKARDMGTRQLTILLAGIFLFSFLITDPASASIAYQGKDYSNVFGKQIVVCDQEKDGRRVGGEFRTVGGGGGVLVDGNGSKSPCADQVVNRYITAHRTCESVKNGPKYCSAWSFH